MKKTIFFACCASCMLSNGAFAYDFNDEFYGKANVKMGYSFEKVRGDIADENKIERGLKEFGFDLKNTDYLHNLNFVLGYDIYFRATDLIHPFFGVDFGVALGVGVAFGSSGLLHFSVKLILLV